MISEPLPGRLQSSGPWLASGLCCPPGHRLLWPHPSLSDLPPTYLFSYSGSFPVSLFQGCLRGSPIYSTCLSLRAVFHSPLDREGAFDRFFPSRIGLRQFCNGSASKRSTQSDSTWGFHEAAKFTSCYGPAGLLALHRSGLLLSSFHSLCRHRKRRVQLRGHTVNSRGWTFTSKTRSIMGCEQNEPNRSTGSSEAEFVVPMQTD